MHYFTIMLKSIVIVSFLALFFSCSVNAANKKKTAVPIEEVASFDSLRLTQTLYTQLDSVNYFISKNTATYSNNIAILIDMRIPSNYNRLFVVNLKTKEIISRGLCAHGAGSEISGSDSLQFSNIPNSYMTSLGLYRIGNAYMGNFGKSYKLHGLEKSNDKAFERVVVFHRYQCVPDDEQPYPICTSLGCPMLAENKFEEIIPLIDQEKKAVVMKIYY